MNNCRRMIIFCVLQFYDNIFNHDLTLEFMLVGLANPSLFCLLESRMLYKLKEEAARRAKVDNGNGTVYLSEIRFSVVQA